MKSDPCAIEVYILELDEPVGVGRHLPSDMLWLGLFLKRVGVMGYSSLSKKVYSHTRGLFG